MDQVWYLLGGVSCVLHGTSAGKDKIKVRTWERRKVAINGAKGRFSWGCAEKQLESGDLVDRRRRGWV